MPQHYCTYFDKNYLARGLTLYHSLARYAQPFTLWVLCLDDAAYQMLSALNYPDLKPVPLVELEKFDTDLAASKKNRSLIEFYFTCSPAWPLYLLKTFSEIDVITYLDSDLWFYADPTPFFDELGDNSILIVRHNFPKNLKHLEEFGKFNVGILSFRNDRNGLACLEWWRARCLEWCYDRLEGERFADQKYLDEWPERFEKVVILQHKGINLAPWNWKTYSLNFDKNGIRVDGQPLICYHFHRLKQLNSWFFDPQEDLYNAMPITVRWRLYLPYIRNLKKLDASLHRSPILKKNLTLAIRHKNYSWRRLIKRLLTGHLIIAP